MNDKVIDEAGLLDIVNHHGIKLTSQDIKWLSLYFSGNGYSYNDVRAIINGARKKLLITGKTGEYINLNLTELVNRYFSAADVAMYRAFDVIDAKFKEYYKKRKLEQKKTSSHKGLDFVMRRCFQTSKKMSEESNQIFAEISQEELDNLNSLASIYYAIVSHLGAENDVILEDGKYVSKTKDTIVAENDVIRKNKSYKSIVDYIVGERIANLSSTSLNKIDRAQVRNFTDFLDSINDEFSGTEIKNMLLNCISIVKFASAEKWSALKRILTEYVDGVKQMPNCDDETLKSLSQMTAKSFVLRAGSIFQAVPENVEATTKLCLGQKISTIKGVDDHIDVASSQTKRQELFSLFGDMSIEGMDAKSNLSLMMGNVTCLSNMSLKNVFDMNMSLIGCISKALGVGEDAKTDREKVEALRATGFNTDRLYSVDNFTIVFSVPVIKMLRGKTKDSRELLDNISKNFNMISGITSIKTAQEILLHNVVFYFQNSEVVAEKLRAIILKNRGTRDKFLKEFNEMVNMDIAVNYIIGVETKVSEPKSVRGDRLIPTAIIDNDRATVNVDEISGADEISQVLGVDAHDVKLDENKKVEEPKATINTKLKSNKLKKEDDNRTTEEMVNDLYALIADIINTSVYTKSHAENIKHRVVKIVNLINKIYNSNDFNQKSLLGAKILVKEGMDSAEKLLNDVQIAIAKLSVKISEFSREENARKQKNTNVKAKDKEIEAVETAMKDPLIGQYIDRNLLAHTRESRENLQLENELFGVSRGEYLENLRALSDKLENADYLKALLNVLKILDSELNKEVVANVPIALTVSDELHSREEELKTRIKEIEKKIAAKYSGHEEYAETNPFGKKLLVRREAYKTELDKLLQKKDKTSNGGGIVS